MLVDIHIHELNGSLDSQLNIFKAIEKAENRNLDAICITDHDSLYLRDKIMKIILDKITKKYSDNIALKDISIEIQRNKITAILGPSGCGKTTLLRIIAGLIKQNKGDIYFNDKIINHLPTQERNAAMVFQNYALFLHLSVKDNIAYGLKNQTKEKNN